MEAHQTAQDISQQVLAMGSKSFALAARLLPRRCREDAAVIYTWCRRADDAIDLAALTEQPSALRQIKEELLSLYGGAPQSDPVMAAFQEVIQRRKIPMQYPKELVLGLEMDVSSVRYSSLEALLSYCFRVAGTVGLMMCHVLGVREEKALQNAAHLGIAMQLTNICRDFAEDWERGRLYIPESLLSELGAPRLSRYLGGPLPEGALSVIGEALRRLLAEAEAYYRSGALGLASLSWRASFAIRAAAFIYKSIGRQISRLGYDILAGRAVVRLSTKLSLALKALGISLSELPRRLHLPFVPVVIERTLSFPEDILSSPQRP